MSVKKLLNNFSTFVLKQGIIFNFIFVLLLSISVWNDLHFFDFSYCESGSYYVPSGSPHYILFYVTLKIAFAWLLYLGMAKGKKLIKGVVRKNADARRYLIFFLIIFGIYLVFLLVCWPGVWWCTGADEFKLVWFTKHLQVQYHQGFMIAFVYFMAFMIYPTPAMVVILQALIGAVCFSWILSDLWKKYRMAAFVLLVFVVLSPCGIYFSLYPMRAYLTGVFFATFIYIYAKVINYESISRKDWMRLALIGSLLINARVEMKLLIVFFPLLFIKNIRTDFRECKKVLLVTGCLCLSVFLVGRWEKLGNQACSATHNLISFFAPLGEILVHDGYDVDIDELVLLDKFFDINLIVEEHNIPGNELNYSGYERLNAPSNMYDSKELIKAEFILVKLMLEHPGCYLKNKAVLAANTFGIIKSVPNRHRFPDEIKPDEVAGMFCQINPVLAGWVKEKLAGDFYIGKIYVFKYMYAMWLPVFLLALDFVYGIIKRDGKYLAMEVLILSLFCVVFLMAMHKYTMYYFAPYIGACFMLVVSVAQKARKAKTNESKN